MNFKAFASVVIGIGLIGISVGYVLGFYLKTVLESNHWAYIGSPILGIGSGLVLYGALFHNKNKS